MTHIPDAGECKLTMKCWKIKMYQKLSLKGTVHSLIHDLLLLFVQQQQLLDPPRQLLNSEEPMEADEEQQPTAAEEEEGQNDEEEQDHTKMPEHPGRDSDSDEDGEA